ncbi:hypothetical protein BDN72DRAFT_850335 [Pluteus cervinus]|uniref:Uncharacterized protein n=1 Tax=Pluteus cervinus TaxID=181527 RepID=A0ACD3A4P7_9AGAR|nr:hypothetical protein BDN72DRAFT_850335 [Pluteus cervinus]
MSYIATLTPYYGEKPEDEPPASVPELLHRGDDINQGFRGSYVWLQPVYGPLETAASSFEILIQPNANPNLLDLAKGAGGDYRYLVPTTSSGSARVTAVALLRTPFPVTEAPVGWQSITTDINAGRNGDYLYIISKLST